MIRSFIIPLLFITLPVMLFSQQIGYQIKVEIEDFEGQEAYLGYYYGDKQYLSDTAYLEADGRFYFEGNEKLKPGLYMIVMPPDNQFFQLLVGEEDQWFEVKTKAPDFTGKMEISGSDDNQLFYGYMNFISSKRPEAEELNQKIEEAGDDVKKKEKLEEKLNELDQAVESYQLDIIRKHPKTLTAAIIKANRPLDVPEFKEDKDLKSFYWMRDHWFDHIDIADPAMLRTPFLFQKIDHYVSKMTVQHPDSISQSIDRVLEMARPSDETFKYYLIHFLNEFAKSKIVGMDAVYVHIANKYYATGQAPWTEADQLKKIVENAAKLEPLLIGKKAPNLEMQTRTGEKIELHDFESPLTVLFFWDPECGHCKKSMPEMVEFAKNYKDKGVSVFSICTKLITRDEEGNFSMKEVDTCWPFIDEKGMNVFFNTVDPYHRSRYKTIYDIRSTPQVYVLDKDKTILSKRLGAEQLPEVIDHILKVRAEEQQKEGSGE